MTENNELWAALALAQDRAKAVGKDARNEFARYDYASSESIIRAANEQLNSSGLSVIPAQAKLEKAESEWMLRRTFLVSHSTGQSVELSFDFPVVVTTTQGKAKPLDKAHASALTMSYAYFLRDLLRIPRVDADDDELHHHEEYRPSAKAERKEQHRPPTPAKAERKEERRLRPLPPTAPEKEPPPEESERRRKVAEFEERMRAGTSSKAQSQESGDGSFETSFEFAKKSHPKLGPDTKLTRDIPFVSEAMIGMTFGECMEWQDRCQADYKAMWKELNGSDRACVLWGIYLHRERAGVVK